MEPLPLPARYFPLEKGLYEVAPGLRTLGTPFGNGEADAKVFQLDSEFGEYRANKLRCRAERLAKYCLSQDLDPAVARAVASFLANRLVAEHPSRFSLSAKATLECRLTGETLVFSPDFDALIETRGEAPPAYASPFDALCSQVQEDVAIMVAPPGREERLVALHLCSPSHWSGEDKIGKNFAAIHEPVPGIEKINRAAPALVEAMIRKGPYVRFVWSFSTDRQLNHHPVPPPGIPLGEWRGRSFRLDDPASRFILRIERQCLVGLPAVNAAVFTIRVSFVDGERIRANPAERALLRSALLSMSTESLAYKGLRDSLGDLLRWLET